MAKKQTRSTKSSPNTKRPKSAPKQPTPSTRSNPKKKQADDGASAAENSSATSEGLPSKFDVDKFAKPQDFDKLGATKRQQGNYEARKPQRQQFIRVRPGKEYRCELPVLDFGPDSQHKLYLIDNCVYVEIFEEFERDTFDMQFRLVITRQGNLFLWPLRVPDSNSPGASWHESALRAADRAEEEWIKVVSNMEVGGYDTYSPRSALPDPQWPDLELATVIEKAFRGRIIDTLDHPVLKELRGEL